MRDVGDARIMRYTAIIDPDFKWLQKSLLGKRIYQRRFEFSMSLLPPLHSPQLNLPAGTLPRLPDRIQPTIPSYTAKRRKTERVFGDPFHQSIQHPERITVLLPEEEKMNEDAREAFSKLSQSADDFLNILAAATLRHDIFFALSLFESMCDTTAHLDKLWRLVEMYRLVKDSKMALATNHAKSAESIITAGARGEPLYVYLGVSRSARKSQFVGHADKFGERSRTHLAHDLPAMNADGDLAGTEFRGGLLIRQSRDHEGQYFPFAGREQRVVLLQLR